MILAFMVETLLVKVLVVVSVILRLSLGLKGGPLDPDLRCCWLGLLLWARPGRGSWRFSRDEDADDLDLSAVPPELLIIEGRMLLLLLLLLLISIICSSEEAAAEEETPLPLLLMYLF